MSVGKPVAAGKPLSVGKLVAAGKLLSVGKPLPVHNYGNYSTTIRNTSTARVLPANKVHRCKYCRRLFDGMASCSGHQLMFHGKVKYTCVI